MPQLNPSREGRSRVGYVIGGSLKDQLIVRLTIRPHEIQEGSFVVIDSGIWNFYGLVSNIQLGATDARFAEQQTLMRFPAPIIKMLHEQTLYTNLEVMPVLMLESGPDPKNDSAYHDWQKTQGDERPHPMPIKTVPEHQADVWQASAGDIAEIFGDPDDKRKKHFVLGTTREQDHPVCIDLEKFVQRSSGIFGATGTGKSFLTRMMLAGLIHHNAASILMFDMHNEYGFDDLASDTKTAVPGLRSKFRSQVRVVGLGADTSVHGQPVDFTLELAQQDINPGDIELLSRELDLKDTTPVTLQALTASFGRNWFKAFRDMEVGTLIEDDNGKKIPAPGSVAQWARENGVNEQAAEGLRRKLNRVFALPYLVEKPAADSVGQIVQTLQKGQHIILSFGNHENDLDYLLVSNVLTRRIREAWEKQTNTYKQTRQNEPRPLMIAIEEAHKLLNREMASQTIFSTIARELRKYYVTLLVIDQRPSQIYDEVLSQLGTRISGWLGDDTDIQAVLSGISGKDALRGMLSRLQPKEEVLILGWGVPMPIPIRTLRYDDSFWQRLFAGKSGKSRSEEEIIQRMFGKEEP
jgi:uncharacterized protein